MNWNDVDDSTFKKIERMQAHVSWSNKTMDTIMHTKQI